MIINLKQINLSDSDNIKLDKINYNFDQLVANGGGPMGSTGPMGNQGATGITGAQGYQGPIGAQGNQGDPGANTTAYWKNIAGGGAVPVDTILPIHDPLISTHPPVVSVGFISTDPEYGTGQNPQQGQLPYQWIINRRSNFIDNLRFTSSDVVGNYFRFRLENDTINSINKFTMGFLNPSNTSIIWHAQNHIFIDNTTGAQLLTITDSSITYHRDVEFDKPVTVNGQLKIGNANAAIDKIAVASDSNGTVTFKSIDELGGIVPYGTIVSILPSVFSNNNNFINSETVTLNDINDLLKVRVGRGVNDYAGWYICNGKTWKSDSSNLQHATPDLNSFSYTIQDNAATISQLSQGLATETNNDTHIVGGANIQMNAVNPILGVYAVASTVTTTDTTISSASGTTFKIKKLPQIIYLGDDDCYWQDAGSGQAPITQNTYYIDDLNNTATGSLTASTVRTNQQGTSDQFTIRVYAAAGYYFDTLPSGGAFNATSPGYSVVFIQSGGGTYVTFFDVTISATQSANGISRFIEWNSSTYVQQIPSFQLTLTRFTSPSNSSMLPLNNGTITYNTATGYNFNIVVTASTNYLFGASNAISFTGGTSPSGATFTINSSQYTGIANGYQDDEKQITMNVTLSGVPYGTTTVAYGLQGGPILQAPQVQLTLVNAGTYPLSNSSQTSPSVSIINNGGTTVYIRSYAISYINDLSYFLTAAGFGSLPVSTANGSTVTYSSNYVTLTSNQSWSGTLYFNGGNGSSFVAGFAWSNSINGPWTVLN